MTTVFSDSETIKALQDQLILKAVDFLLYMDLACMANVLYLFVKRVCKKKRSEA